MVSDSTPEIRPFLQYPDGDVVISLAPNGLHDLILHSDVLSRFSDFFKAGMSDRWVGNKITGTKIIAGKCVDMKRYELVVAEGDTLYKGHTHDLDHNHFLEGKVCSRCWLVATC